MRWYFALISLVASMAFFMGYVSLSLKDNLTNTSLGALEVKNLIKTFERQVAPIAVLDFQSLYNRPGQMKLLNPLYTLTSYASLRLMGEKGVPKCMNALSSSTLMFNNYKEFIWNRYICGEIPRLPYDFFVQRPFIHSYGFSYPYLASQLDEKPFNKVNWLRDNIPLFHVTELPYLNKKIGRLEGDYAVLSGFTRQELLDLLKSENSILSNDKYMVKTNSKNTSFGYGLVYKVYDRSHLQGFIDSSRFQVTRWSLGKECTYRTGKVCWNYIPTPLNKFLSESSSYLFYALLGLLVFIIGMILNKLKLDKAEDENRKMALRVLTHEFRTPVTSLMLQIENLMRFSEGKDYDEVIGTQHLKIKDNIYRLKRLTEMSQKYLSTENKEKNFNFTKIESINDYIQEIVDDYPVDISFRGLDKDQPFKLEPYWITICVRNLIENAIKHGEQPIEVALKKVSGQLEIKIQDSGKVKDVNMGRLTGAFVKGNKSEGMGLGLNIVNKAIKDLGGKLILEKDPTRFYLRIKEGKI